MRQPVPQSLRCADRALSVSIQSRSLRRSFNFLATLAGATVDDAVQHVRHTGEPRWKIDSTSPVIAPVTMLIRLPPSAQAQHPFDSRVADGLLLPNAMGPIWLVGYSACTSAAVKL